MADPWPVQGLTVQGGMLDILVLLATILSNDMEDLAVANVHLDIREQGTSDIVNRETGCYRIETKAGEYHEGGQTATVLITGDAHQVVTEPGFQTLADALLRLPGSTCIIIYIRYMQRRLVGHGELPDVSCLVRQLSIELTLATTHTLGKGLIQILHQLFPTPHQPGQVGKVMLHIPTVGPSVVLVIGITCTYAASEAVVEVLQELAVLILGMEKLSLRIPYVAVVIAQFQVLLLQLPVT